jgi:hypothetical protein
MRLVFFVDIATKGFALGIEDDGNVAMRIIPDQAPDHIDHAFNGAGGLALTTDQWRQSMECPEQIG